MRIRLVGEMSGTRDGQDWPPRGSVVDLPDEEAAQLLARGMARPVEDAPVEAATPLTTDVMKAVVPSTPRKRATSSG